MVQFFSMWSPTHNIHLTVFCLLPSPPPPPPSPLQEDIKLLAQHRLVHHDHRPGAVR